LLVGERGGGVFCGVAACPPPQKHHYTTTPNSPTGQQNTSHQKQNKQKQEQANACHLRDQVALQLLVFSRRRRQALGGAP
jgi:hypothetical protein